MYDQPPFLRTREVARLCGVRPEAVRALVRRGVLRPVRLGPRGWLRVRREEVERLLNQNGAAASGGQSTRTTCGTAASRTPPPPGTSPEALMSRAGHASYATTKRYIDTAGERFRDEADRLEERLWGKQRAPGATA